jgi:hypothetical protein
MCVWGCREEVLRGCNQSGLGGPDAPMPSLTQLLLQLESQRGAPLCATEPALAKHENVASMDEMQHDQADVSI